MLRFLLLLGFFTNFNYVTLERKVNVALTAELQFNENDIKEIDKVQKYLAEIKKHILLNNLRKHNVKQQNNEKNGNSNNNNEYRGKNRSLRKNKNSNIHINMIDIEVRTSQIKNTKKNWKTNYRSNSKNYSFKTTAVKKESKTFHVHDIQNKLVIIETTPKITKQSTKHATKSSIHSTKHKELTKIATKHISEHSNFVKTTVGKPESKDIHIHDINNKLVIMDLSTTKNTTKRTTLNIQPIIRYTTIINKLIPKKSKSTKPPSARKHLLTTLSTDENTETKTSKTEKSTNEALKLTTKYNDDLKEKDEKHEYLWIPSNENYNNIDEYLKSKKVDNDDKNKEVLEKMKSDLGNLFSSDITNPTSEKADSFQELERAFGFEM